MNGDGLVSKGWLNQSEKPSYYLDDSTGKMITGWKSDSGKWYYFGSSGALFRDGLMTTEPGITATRMA